MATAAPPLRMQQVTALEASDHWYLSLPDDVCYFHGDYTARGGYTASATNQLIANFKKKMDRKDRPEWRYKESAIRKAAEIFVSALRRESLLRATLVPLPPSKARDDPMHDDRMKRVLLQMQADVGSQLDIRDILHFPESQIASHERTDRPSPDQLYDAMAVRRQQIGDPDDVTNVWLFDDVLTTGAHFKAAARHIADIYPGARVRGIFIARRVPEGADFDFDFDAIDDD